MACELKTKKKKNEISTVQILILHKFYIIDKESVLLKTKWGH